MVENIDKSQGEREYERNRNRAISELEKAIDGYKRPKLRLEATDLLAPIKFSEALRVVRAGVDSLSDKHILETTFAYLGLRRFAVVGSSPIYDELADEIQKRFPSMIDDRALYDIMEELKSEITSARHLRLSTVSGGNRQPIDGYLDDGV